MPELHEVFTISGIPHHTFVPPNEYTRLLVALKTPGRGIVIEGPSGIGKTTAVMKAIEEADISRPIIKLSARKVPDVAFVKELPTMLPLGIVIVDDFHKLPTETKAEIADLMKVLADESTADSKVIVIGINRAGESLISFAERRFYNRTQDFAKGTRLRREGRAPYLHLLYWLGTSEEWTLSLDQAIMQHPELRGSLIQIIEKDYLLGLMNSVPAIGEVLHFEQSSRLLTVEDPQYIFFLRNLAWPGFASDLGYLSVDFRSRYDFALSFAGTERGLAEAIFKYLQNYDFEVFYDKNEQHRILAVDIEDYLRPIYQSDAQYVIALLSKEYPKRIWAKIESDTFKKRFGEGAVIPIWFTDAPRGMFDETARIGGCTFDPSRDLDTQVAEICEQLRRKIGESRVNKNQLGQGFLPL